MTNTHTPGPWHVTPGTVPAESVWDETGNLQIASFIEGRGWQEQHANARLIAAAPDLLAASRAALAALEALRDAPQGGAEVMLRAAIAKAEGRE